MRLLAADVKLALRRLCRNRALTYTCILALTLGIGTSFSALNIVDRVLLRPLPVDRPQELIAIQNVFGAGVPRSLSYPMFEGVREQLHGSVDVFGYGTRLLRIGKAPDIETVTVLFASGNAAATLGLRPLAGRFFSEEEDRSGASPVLVVSQAFATQHFGSAQASVGKALTLEGLPFSIIGVAPPKFEGLAVGVPNELFVPLESLRRLREQTPTFQSPTLLWVNLIGRPRPGVSAPQVNSMLSTAWPQILDRIKPAFSTDEGRTRYFAQRLQVVSAARGFSSFREHNRTWLLTFLALTAVLSLLAFVNVLVLYSVRLLSDAPQIAIRTALGARAMDTFRHYATEAFVLIGFAATLAVFGGYWASRVVVNNLSTGVGPVNIDVLPRPITLLSVMAASGLFGCLIGTMAVLQRRSLAATLQSRTAVGQRRVGIRLLAAVQTVVLLPLLVAAIQLASSLLALQRSDLGFRPDNVVAVSLSSRPGGYGERDLPAYYRELLDQVRAIPDVSAASLALNTPLMPATWRDTVANASAGSQESAVITCVSPGFFDTLGTPVLRGQDFNQRSAAPEKSVIINASLAARLFPNSDPVGQAVAVGAGRQASNGRIVGVVRDSKLQDIRAASSNDVYLSCLEDKNLAVALALVFRTRSPSSIAATRKVIANVGALGVELPIMAPVLLTNQLRNVLGPERLLAALGSALALVAVVLSTVGILGASAYVAHQRLREVGVRLALGATPGNVMRLLARANVLLLTAALPMGLATAWLFTRAISAQAHGIDASDTRTFLIAGGVTFAIGLVAVLVPAKRAASQDPSVLLRTISS